MGHRRRDSRSSPAVDCTILDANSRQSLVMARVLGRAGLRVALAETADESPPIPAFHSSYCVSRTVLPSIRNSPDAYVAAVLDLLERQPTKVLIPALDASIAALRLQRSSIEGRTRLALASETGLDVANDKSKTLALATKFNIRTPRSTLIESPSQLAAALADTGLPAVIKPATSWVWNGASGSRVLSKEVVDPAEATDVCNDMFDAGCKALALQEYVRGRREALYVFYRRETVWAEFALVAHRMSPVLGGFGVLRESIPIPDDLRAATSMIEAANIEGLSEIEFRRDDSGRPVLMEINARPPGTLELATRAGVDFPKYLWDWATGAPLKPFHGNYRMGVRLRYLYGDIQWLLEHVRKRARPESVNPVKALGMFSSEFLKRDAYDYWDSRDLRPTIVASLRTVPGSLRRVRQFRRTRVANTATAGDP